MSRITDVNEIGTSNWSMGLGGFGQIVQEAGEINQTIGIILMTQKGSDPFRPEFGSDVWNYISKPINSAAPNIVRAITDALNRWEKRIIIESISYSTQPQRSQPDNIPAGLIFSISWKTVGSELNETLDLIIGQDQSGNGNGIIRILGTENDKAISTDSGKLIKV